MTNNAENPQTVPLDRIRGELHDYARTLQAAGFTVYAPARNARYSPPPASFFIYSRTVDGQECFGTVQLPQFRTLGEALEHSMPITPSRLNGSGAHIGAAWGDPDTLGLDNMGTESVEYARAVARPSNWCPFNAEPTREATDRANAGGSVPQRFYNGATLANAKPYGIGTSYLPVSTD